MAGADHARKLAGLRTPVKAQSLDLQGIRRVLVELQKSDAASGDGLPRVH
jgi:hypothetical protein